MRTEYLLSQRLQFAYICRCVLRARWNLCIMFVCFLCGLFFCANAQVNNGRQSIPKIKSIDVKMPTLLDIKYDLVVPGCASLQYISWLCYYGSDRDVLLLNDYKLFILEADAFGPLSKEDKADRICLAYMSIGEIVQSRWFWSDVQNKVWLLEENPDWHGARRIDPRSPEWADLLIHKVAPALLAAGYNGFLLDNVDVGEYLENKDPVLYAGASSAIAEIIRRLHENYPDAVIVTNGGLSTAAEVADCLSAVMVESTFSTWLRGEDGTFSYGEISPQSKAWLRPRLLRLRGAGIPILALEYVHLFDTEERQRVMEAVKKTGDHPYIAERSLMLFPANENSNDK